MAVAAGPAAVRPALGAAKVLRQSLDGPAARSALVLLAAALTWRSVDGFVIDAVEHRPTFYGDDAVAGPPTDLRVEKLSDSGYDSQYDSSVQISRFTYIGCFEAAISMGPLVQYVESSGAADPWECIEACREVNSLNNTMRPIVAVSDSTCVCAQDDISLFTEETGASICTNRCKYYENPLCGGPPSTVRPGMTYYGVYREYDFQSMSTQGAYDPWRYIFYTVVAIKETSISGGIGAPYGVMPERYFLHAASTTNGSALFQYALERPIGGLIYGLQYDIDSNRLVGLFTSSSVGRIENASVWTYALATINIYASNWEYVVLSLQLSDIAITLSTSSSYLNYNGVSAIMSVGHDLYLFTQGDNAVQKQDIADRLYIVTIPSGKIMFQAPLYFRVVQLFTNEKYGDITAIGPRYLSGTISGAHQYLYLGRIYNDSTTDPWSSAVDWPFSPNNPTYVTPVANTQDLMLFPGTCASEHLYNTSAIAYRYVPQVASQAAITVAVVDISTGSWTNWCNSGTCQGSMDPEIPFASIINREPGIPLTLKSPAFDSVRFSLDGSTITVTFDRATLKGALPVDTDGNYIPDYVDYTTEQTGIFDCARAFATDTITLLGPYDETYCQWITADAIQIKLPATGSNVEVGDSLFLLPNVIYTVPQNEEWSAAASGGYPISPPDPLVPPVAVLSGATTVDDCSPVVISVVESYNIGGSATYSWTWLTETNDQNNPIDLTNSPDREFDEQRIALIQAALAEATAMNNVTLTLPADYLEGAASYIIVLTLAGQWEAETSKEITITKLNFPAPSVYVAGEDTVYKKRTETTALKAICTPSMCETNVEEKLGYLWISDDDKLDLADLGIVATSSSLSISPYTLAPPGVESTATYNEYRFTVQCFVDSEVGRLEENRASDTVIVQVYRSDVYVQFNTGTRAMTQGDVLVIDARGSQDPDYPTADGFTFQGTFMWWCLDPARATCFGGEDGLLGSTTNLLDCSYDLGNKITEGGTTYYVPIFTDYIYCKYNRGTLMVDTTHFETGEYKFTVEITHYDGRQASADIYITIVDEDIPRITLEILNTQVMYPVTSSINIEGTVEGDVDASATYSWTIFAYVRNPEYNAEEAAAAENDPTNSYNIDEFTFVEQASVFDLSDTSKFVWDPITPNLEIKANVLQASTVYSFQLNVHIGDVSGFSSIEFQTAGLAPLNGALLCDPMDGSIDTPRTITAPDWSATDSPLSYSFGYINNVGGDAVPVQLSSGALPLSEITVSYLPEGEASTDYSLWLFVDVATPFGATTRAQLQINVRPTDDPDSAVTNILEDAANADGADVVNVLNVALSIDPSDPAIQSQVLGILTDAQGDIPATSQELLAQINLLATMVDAGGDGDEVLTMLETLINQGEQYFTTDANSDGDPLASLAFYALGGILPDAADEAEAAARRYRTRRLGAKPARSLFDLFQKPSLDMSHRSSARRLEAERLQELRDAGRQRSNHPPPRGFGQPVHACPTAFCDRPALACFSGKKVSVCCDAPNAETLCNEPPCWFRGLVCPSDPGPVPLRSERRVRPSTSRQVKARRRRRRGTSVTRTAGQEAPEKPSGWLESWQGYNYPLADSQGVNERHLSDFDRASAFEAWHPDMYKRRLQYFEVNATPGDQLLLALEEAEKPVLLSSQDSETQLARVVMARVRSDASGYAAFQHLPAEQAEAAQEEAELQELTDYQEELVYASNESAKITKINVLRDFIAKLLIVTLERGNERSYETPAGTLVIGNTWDMTNARPEFSYPAAYVKPPSTATADCFAYIFMEYVNNIYAWSTTNPPSTEAKIMTVTIWKADGTQLDEESTSEPVNVFANLELYSSVVCLNWNRFADTQGGSWSQSGIINNGTGCLSTHLVQDVGIFVDGRTAASASLTDMASDWQREVWEDNCINCAGQSDYNKFVMALMGMVSFVGVLLILLGYVTDEFRRSSMRRNKVKSRYYYDGDGLTGPMSVDDPIDYAHASRKPQLIVGTLLNVVRREHLLIGLFYFHETFTRPQRVHCLIALVMAILAVNAAVQSHQGYMQAPETFVGPGILSGLLTFPMFCSLFMMFSMRPSSIKKRLIKRALTTREIDMINDQRRKLEQQTAKRPPPGYLAAPPPLPGSLPGQNTLLALSAPLPLPLAPPGMPGGILAPGGLPALPPQPAPGGLPGMLQLPALPGGAGGALPPPPRVPPPRGGGPAALMPPLQWPKVGAPPVPYPALQAQEGSLGGSHAQPHLPMLPSLQGETGGTMQALPSISMTNARAALPLREIQAALPAAEAEVMPPGMVHEDGVHKMAPPGTPPSNDMPLPQRPPEAFTPPGQSPRTPLGPPGGGVGSLTPAGSARGSESGAARGAPPAPLVAQHEGGPVPLFIRGAPPPGLQGPTGPGETPLQALARVPGPPLPSMGPPVPSAAGPGFGGGPGAASQPLPPSVPPPPPPPREDDQAFVRRIRLTYMDKVHMEHEKHELQEHLQALGKKTPSWVFEVMVLMPYAATITFTVVGAMVTLNFGVMFNDTQEELWVQGSEVGLALVVLLLDFVRVTMVTLVELRKYENRRKSKAGHFLPRQVQKPGDNRKLAPPAKFWHKAMAAPRVPKGLGAPSPPPARPRFLPPGDGVPPLPPPAKKAGPGVHRALPPVAPALPVAAAPALTNTAKQPAFSASALRFTGGTPPGSVGGTPRSVLSGTGRSGPPAFGGAGTPPPRPSDLDTTLRGGTPPGTPPGGTPQGFGPGPRLASAGELAGAHSGAATPPSPARSGTSFRGLAESLNQQVQASRRTTPPPPPPGAGPAASTAAPAAAGAAPPSAPSAPPPSYSRPSSRPGTAGSQAKRGGAPGPALPKTPEQGGP